MIYAELLDRREGQQRIFVRCKDRTEESRRRAVDCYEMNIFDSRPDPSYAPARSSISPRPIRCSKAAGKWNTFELLADKRHLSITMNGTKTADVNNGFFEEATSRCNTAARGEVPQGCGQAALTSCRARNLGREGSRRHTGVGWVERSKTHPHRYCATSFFAPKVPHWEQNASLAFDL